MKKILLAVIIIFMISPVLFSFDWGGNISKLFLHHKRG